MAKGAGNGDALLMGCLLVVGFFSGPILLVAYYTRGPILTTTLANCTWWPEPLPPTASGLPRGKSNTVSTRTCMFSRVNITAPMPEGWQDLGYSQRTEGLTTDEAWQNALNNNYVFLGTASEMRMRVQSTNSISSFVCYIINPEYIKDLRVACARVAETCSEDCKWTAPEGRTSTFIDWTLYANKNRAAVFMTPQIMDPSLSVEVKNWGIGLTVMLVSLVVCVALLLLRNYYFLRTNIKMSTVDEYGNPI